MKFAVFLLFGGIQFLTTDAKTLHDFLKPCYKNDPNLNGCILKLMNKGLSLLYKGTPDLDIPSIDPYEIGYFTDNITVEGRTSATVAAKNIKILNLLKMKIENVRIDLDKLSGEIDIIHPIVDTSFDFTVDGKLLNLFMYLEASIRAIFVNVKTNFKMELRIVERKGARYFEIDDFKFKTTVEDGSIQVTPKDQKQQSMTDIIQNLFNDNPKEMLKLSRPFYERNGKKYIRALAKELLNLFPVDVLFSE